MISSNADQEPMLQVKIEDKITPIMLDTGATYSCLSPNYASHLPRSGKFVKTVGFSGLTQLIPMTAPVSIKTKDSEIKIPVLVSEQTPVNLLGRDAICKLNLQIWCSPEGIYIDDKGIKQMTVIGDSDLQEPQVNIFWLGNIEEGVEETLEKWGKYIKEQLRKPSPPETEIYCTKIYDPLRNPRLEKDWLEKMRDRRYI